MEQVLQACLYCPPLLLEENIVYGQGPIADPFCIPRVKDNRFFYIFAIFMRKLIDLMYIESVNIVQWTNATPDSRQSKPLLTIDERGSKIAKHSVIDYHLSPVCF